MTTITYEDVYDLVGEARSYFAHYPGESLESFFRDFFATEAYEQLFPGTDTTEPSALFSLIAPHLT